MVKIPLRRRKREAGQAILLVVLAMSIFMLGSVGFIIDGSHLYAQRVMAQAAADSAAQSGMMSIFDGTGGAWGTHAVPASGTGVGCSATGMDTAAACKFALSNGFSLAEVTVTPNPTGVTVPNLSPTTTDPVDILQVDVQRTVGTTLMHLLGSSTSTIRARGIAAIVQVVSPTPIIVTHPTMANALDMNGTTGITICGGPQKSIQVNSSGTNPAGAAFNPPSAGNVDLSKAGPSDPGDCTTTNGGGDFGTFGGPASLPSGTVLLGSQGHYYDPSSPIQDPLAGVSPPTDPGGALSNTGQSCLVLGRCGNCPPAGVSPCQEYVPGGYASGINTTGKDAFFDPGVYYLRSGGFTTKNSHVAMCTSCTADATTKNGMVLYDTGPLSGGCDASGGFTIDTNSQDLLTGAGVTIATPKASPAAPYYGILFFEDRNACGHIGNQKHTLGAGNGGSGNCFSIVGTVYITNTLALMTANPTTRYQAVEYHGVPCTGVSNVGEIIVSQLTIKGTSGLSMSLFPTTFLTIRQVALVY